MFAMQTLPRALSLDRADAGACANPKPTALGLRDTSDRWSDDRGSARSFAGSGARLLSVDALYGRPIRTGSSGNHNYRPYRNLGRVLIN
jgi:hypothetical protein